MVSCFSHFAVADFFSFRKKFSKKKCLNPCPVLSFDASSKNIDIDDIMCGRFSDTRTFVLFEGY
jgi:hypothetical protein